MLRLFSRRIRVLVPALIVTLFSFPLFASDYVVTNSGEDGNREGTIESIVEGVDAPGKSIGFAPGVNPILQPYISGPNPGLQVTRDTIQIIGNGPNINPTASLRSAASSHMGAAAALRSYMSGQFSTEATSTVTAINSDTSRTTVDGSGGRLFHSLVAYEAVPVGTTGNGMSLSGLRLTSSSATPLSVLDGGYLAGAASSYFYMLRDGTGAPPLVTTSVDASLGNVTSSVFSDISLGFAVPGTGTAELLGGGLVGASAKFTINNFTVTPVPNPTEPLSVSANVGNIENNVFSDINLSFTKIGITGGGIIGAATDTVYVTHDEGGINPPVTPGPNFSSSTASLGDIRGNLFNKITVSMNELDGGGIVGVKSSPGTMGSVVGNIFNNISVTVGEGHLEGGGILGIKSYSSGDTPLVLDSISDNIFSGLTVTTAAALKPGDTGRLKIQGGGIIGMASFAGLSSTVGFGKISNNIFYNLNISSGAPDLTSTTEMQGEIRGGGVIGVYAGSFGDGTTPGRAEAYIDSIENSVFMDIDVKAEHVFGGGIAGTVAISNGERYSTIKRIDNSLFTGITTTATGGTGGCLMREQVAGCYGEPLKTYQFSPKGVYSILLMLL